jgi:putative iron-dependent peroxidase
VPTCASSGRLLLERLGREVTVVDEVQGFRYFDSRDLRGFVNGTENPIGLVVAGSSLIGAEGADFFGGSSAIVQKYLHDLAGWDLLTNSRSTLLDAGGNRRGARSVALSGDS